MGVDKVPWGWVRGASKLPGGEVSGKASCKRTTS